MFQNRLRGSTAEGAGISHACSTRAVRATFFTTTASREVAVTVRRRIGSTKSTGCRSRRATIALRGDVGDRPFLEVDRAREPAVAPRPLARAGARSFLRTKRGWFRVGHGRTVWSIESIGARSRRRQGVRSGSGTTAGGRDRCECFDHSERSRVSRSILPLRNRPPDC